jgi:hypothetical protein
MSGSKIYNLPLSEDGRERWCRNAAHEPAQARQGARSFLEFGQLLMRPDHADIIHCPCVLFSASSPICAGLRVEQ